MGNKPYTYYLYWQQMNVGYVGVRIANKRQAEDDLWHVYKTSCKHVHEFAKEHGNPDVRVHWEHNTREEAIADELRLFSRLSKIVRDRFVLNRHFGHSPPSATGQPLHKEHRKKISNAKLGAKASKEARARMSIAHTGVPLSEEHRAQIGKGQKGIRKHSDETRKKISAAMKNPSSETRKKISDARRGIQFSEETRKRMSESAKARWAK